MTNFCEVCKKAAFQGCSACNEAFYCCKDHQRQDWKRHKNNCAPYKLQADPVLGRYLIASRDIKQGEVIMKKYPLVLGPKTASPPLCLGCHQRLSLEIDRYNCTKCKWPLCSKQCEKSPLHIHECEVFTKGKFEPYIEDSSAKQTVYSAIAPLRAVLLKKRDRTKFETLLKCQSHLKEHLKTPVYAILRQNLVPLFLEVLGLKTTEEEILNICSIFDTNSFEVRDNRGLVNVRGLYPNIVFLSHDCKTNTKHSFHGDHFQVVLTATVPIKKGEKITATYTQTLWGTLTRRSHLKQAKMFDCTCERCKDPTEFGTYAGSILCTRCKDGDAKMMSTDTLDKTAPWRCEKCAYEVQGKQMVMGNELLKKEISSVDKSNPGGLEAFLIKYSAALHPKNSHCLEVKYALSQMYGNMDGFELEDEDFFGEKELNLGTS